MKSEYKILANGDVFLTWPDCGLRCCFCQHGLEKPTGYLQQLQASIQHLKTLFVKRNGQKGSVIESLDHFLSRAGQTPAAVVLAGWDVLEHPDVKGRVNGSGPGRPIGSSSLC